MYSVLKELNQMGNFSPLGAATCQRTPKKRPRDEPRCPLLLSHPLLWGAEKKHRNPHNQKISLSYFHDLKIMLFLATSVLGRSDVNPT